jgi:hypothetical protein
MFGDMENSRRKGFETIGEAASRLLAGLVRRAEEKKAVPAYSGTQIQNPADVPRKLGHGASEESALGFGAHHPRKLPAGQTGEKATGTEGGESVPVLSAATLGGEGRGRLEFAANDNGQIFTRGTKSHAKAGQTARLTRDELDGSTDRAARSRVEW